MWEGVFGAWLIIVTAWIGQTAPSRPEAGSGLVVAGYQLAITRGTDIGGVLTDATSIRTALLLAAAAALFGGILFGKQTGTPAHVTEATTGQR